MKLHIKVVLIVVALFLALFILGLSIVSSVLSVHSNPDILRRSLYIDDQVLPDHISYPVLMALDRARLEIATPVERVYLQTE